ncbi:hypothetical protein C8F04DRAFT_1189394 [Mycena alexandri]|uniref:Uncharacterized protein n=1 Tax=Mycena alexandri TaxID=1745969 RepID=A0AAD6SI42_9AGAR|nr:hypothetical protein C8F04DRAFT_1189394 [Mycena alexandri]
MGAVVVENRADQALFVSIYLSSQKGILWFNPTSFLPQVIIMMQHSPLAELSWVQIPQEPFLRAAGQVPQYYGYCNAAGGGIHGVDKITYRTRTRGTLTRNTAGLPKPVPFTMEDRAPILALHVYEPEIVQLEEVGGDLPGKEAFMISRCRRDDRKVQPKVRDSSCGTSSWTIKSITACSNTSDVVATYNADQKEERAETTRNAAKLSSGLASGGPPPTSHRLGEGDRRHSPLPELSSKGLKIHRQGFSAKRRKFLE